MKTSMFIILRLIIFVKVSIAAIFVGIGVGLAFDSGISTFPIVLAGVYLITFLPFYIVVFLPQQIIFKPPLPLKVYYIYVIVVVSMFILIIASVDVKYAFTNSDIYRKIKFKKICFINNDKVSSNSVLILYNNKKEIIRLHPSDNRCIYFDKKDNIIKLRAIKCNEIEQDNAPNTYEEVNMDRLLKQKSYNLNIKYLENDMIISPSSRDNETFEWIMTK